MLYLVIAVIPTLILLVFSLAGYSDEKISSLAPLLYGISLLAMTMLFLIANVMVKCLEPRWRRQERELLNAYVKEYET